ncbi:MAG: hypothetical protein JSV16_00115 [Candidatus Hydrogenedentota bacterium]|nr:MAG: hypothetical protein JSV16_00115 [Candidatus Hydrogenedentota bacterium]
MRESEKDNVHFLDLSNLLDHDSFHDWYSHCTVEGRRKIAEALVPKVLDITREDSGSQE